MEHRIKTLTRKQKEMLVTGKRLDVVTAKYPKVFIRTFGWPLADL